MVPAHAHRGGDALRIMAARARDGRLSVLKACPNCGKKEGKLADRRPARFLYAVICGACGWTTDWVRIAGVAEKLWNDAKKK
jgi:hypothetical protein